MTLEFSRFPTEFLMGMLPIEGTIKDWATRASCIPIISPTGTKLALLVQLFCFHISTVNHARIL